jgi:hypothetical protein
MAAIRELLEQVLAELKQQTKMLEPKSQRRAS